MSICTPDSTVAAFHLSMASDKRNREWELRAEPIARHMTAISWARCLVQAGFSTLPANDIKMKDSQAGYLPIQHPGWQLKFSNLWTHTMSSRETLLLWIGHSTLCSSVYESHALFLSPLFCGLMRNKAFHEIYFSKLFKHAQNPWGFKTHFL